MKVTVLSARGHESFEDLTPEEAKELIEKIELTEGERYFIIDQKTKQILKEIKLEPDQAIALVPIVAGG